MASPLVAGVKRIDSNDDPVDLASWPTARLKVLAHFVQDEVALYGDGFGMAPSDENVGYWLSAMGACKLPMRVEPAQLAAAVEKSLERVDITCVMPWRLFLGDLSAHESRLAMMVLGITSMIVISSADHVLPFPARDGIEYLHLSLSADLQPQLNKAVAFLGRHSPTLVCTEGGHGEGEQGEGAGARPARDERYRVQAGDGARTLRRGHPHVAPKDPRGDFDAVKATGCSVSLAKREARPPGSRVDYKRARSATRETQSPLGRDFGPVR